MITALTLSAVLTVAQVRVLNQAYEEGSKYGLGKTLQSIVLQESSAGADRKHRDKLSTGVGQVRLQTARLFDPNATIGRLQEPAYNLRISALYLAYCKAHTHSWRQAVACYHL